MKELIIDNEFKRLSLSRSNEQIHKLKESILLHGCIRPLPVWRNILLDGVDRYNICIENGISFEIAEKAFTDKDEAVEWICTRQLKRENLPSKMKIYIIGKLYETQKRIGRNIGIPANVIAKELSEKFKKYPSTLNKYSLFSRTIDELADTHEEYINDILSGKISMPYDNIYKMISEAEKHIKQYAKCKVSNKPVSAQIKIMPAYDPDADLAGLKLTIPSWIGSIDRVKNSGDFENSTSGIKMQLMSALNDLISAAENIIKLLEDTYHE